MKPEELITGNRKHTCEYRGVRFVLCYALLAFLPSTSQAQWVLKTAITANNWNLTPGLGTLPLSVTSGSYVLHSYDNAANSADTHSGYECGAFRALPKGGTPQSKQDWPDSLKLYWIARSHFVQGNDVEMKRALDTMRLYIERHPFATTNGGMTLDALRDVGSFAAGFTVDPGYVNQKLQYNWYVGAQQWNQDPAYQREIFLDMAFELGYDPNLECNMLYNYTLIYPDSEASAFAWNIINPIRRGQRLDRQDTTPFTRLTFPLKKIPVENAVTLAAASVGTNVRLVVSPNPATSKLTASFELAHGGETSLIIFDELGRTVKELVNGPRAGGPGEVSIPLNDLTSGHYFVRLSSGGEVLTKELVIQH